MTLSNQQPTAEDALEALVRLLSRARVDYLDEKVCQQQIAAFLSEHNVPFVREAPIGSGYVDFVLPRSQLAIEVKAAKRWSRREVYRQCEDYCQDSAIRALLLVTGRCQGLPTIIKGKPVRVLQLGLAHL